MTALRQLLLFQNGRGLRARRRRAPPATEFKVHCMVADMVRRWIKPGWRWTHLPFGEKRTAATGARLKRMGVTRGWPDLLFVHERGRVCWLELKRSGRTVTDAQADLLGFLRLAGHDICVAASFREAIETLQRWGVLPVGIRVQ